MTDPTATPGVPSDRVLAALADPTRARIVDCLRAGPRAVTSLACDLPVSRPAVSQHLRVLSDAGLLTVSQEGTRRLYGLRPEGFEPLRHWLDGLWDDALAAFADAARRQANRHTNDPGDPS